MQIQGILSTFHTADVLYFSPLWPNIKKIFLQLFFPCRRIYVFCNISAIVLQYINQRRMFLCNTGNFVILQHGCRPLLENLTTEGNAQLYMCLTFRHEELCNKASSVTYSEIRQNFSSSAAAPAAGPRIRLYYTTPRKFLYVQYSYLLYPFRKVKNFFISLIIVNFFLYLKSKNC